MSLVALSGSTRTGRSFRWRSKPWSGLALMTLTPPTEVYDHLCLVRDASPHLDPGCSPARLPPVVVGTVIIRTLGRMVRGRSGHDARRYDPQ